MSETNHPPHIQQFLSNIKEVERLQEIHAQVTPPGRGRKYNVGVIHKSCIVLLIACWEAYVEDLVETALDTLIKESTNYKVFPKDVLSRVASSMSGDKAWGLAGDGWKKAMKDNFKSVLSKTTGALNTPRTEQVNDLFKKTIGLSKLSSCWVWANSGVTVNEKYLDDLVTLRCSIAHRVESSESVDKSRVQAAIAFVARIAMKSHNHTNQHLENLLGLAPWNTLSFRGKS